MSDRGAMDKTAPLRALSSSLSCNLEPVRLVLRERIDGAAHNGPGGFLTLERQLITSPFVRKNECVLRFNGFLIILR